MDSPGIYSRLFNTGSCCTMTSMDRTANDGHGFSYPGKLLGEGAKMADLDDDNGVNTPPPSTSLSTRRSSRGSSTSCSMVTGPCKGLASCNVHLPELSTTFYPCNEAQGSYVAKKMSVVVGQEERSMVAFLLDEESTDEEEMDISPRCAPSTPHGLANMKLRRPMALRTGAASILDVPPEIMCRILSFCPLQTILRYKVTSHDGRRISVMDNVWRKAYISHWPRLYRRDKIVAPNVSWQQAFKDRYLFTGGKAEDNQAEDWADFAIVSGSASSSNAGSMLSPSSDPYVSNALSEEARHQEVLQEFNRDLAPRLCECSLVGNLGQSCILFQIRDHLYVCKRSGLSHFCSLAAGAGPCNLSVENFHGCFTCRVTGISGTTAVEPLEIAREDDYELEEEMDIKQISEREYFRGYYMTAREAATTFGFCGQIRDHETILDNPNLPNRKRRKIDIDPLDL